MKKKLAALLLCAAVCLTAGCGSKNTQNTSRNSGTSAAENVKFTRGEWRGNVYTSEMFGFTVTLEGSFVKETDEQLALRNGLPDMSDANFSGAVERSNPNIALYDLTAVNAQRNGNVSVFYNRFNGATLDEYVQATANGLRTSELFMDVVADKTTVGGAERPCVYSTLDSGDAVYKEIMVIYQSGDYFAVVTVMAQTDYNFKYILQNTLG